MFYYDYQYLENNKVGLGWLDLTSRIKDTMALALSKNITEFWTQEAANYNMKVSCSDNADNLLNWADQAGLNYLLVVATGSHLAKRKNLFNALPEYIEKNKDTLTVAGHVLDRWSKFYELHHQCFLVDMNWWRAAGKPFVGEENMNIAWTATKVRRSEENWHDDYTPHWIEKTDDNTDYTGRRYGWNILNEALKSGNRINSFNELIRDNKYYLYPEVEPDFHSKMTDVFNNMQSYSHFVANTETPPDKMPSGMQGVICTAGGLTPLICAYTANLKPGAKVSIFDVSPLSIAIQREFRKAKCNFKNFRQDFENVTRGLQLDSMWRAVDNIDRMQEIIDTLMPQGLEDFINNVWPHLEVLHFEMNLTELYYVRNLINRHKGENTLVHLTNIFHYQNTGWLYSATNRYRLERDLINLFNKEGPDNLFLYSNRPGRGSNWRFHTPRQILSNPMLTKQTPGLECLPWYRS